MATKQIKDAQAMLRYGDALTDYHTRRAWVRQLVQWVRNATFAETRIATRVLPDVSHWVKSNKYARKRAADFARCLVGTRPKLANVTKK